MKTALLRLVELCGRTAYKSEDKITEDSAKKFVLMLKSQGHLSVLEHSNVVLKVEKEASAQVRADPIRSPLRTCFKRCPTGLAFTAVFPC